MNVTGRIVARYFASTLSTALIIWIYLAWLHVNETTVALTFVVIILIVAARWGLRHSIYLSIASAIAFNFFFLPPIFTFTVGDVRNWVALLAFLVTSMIGSNLAERAREEAEHARQRQREAEKLYDLSQTMLLAGNVIELLNDMPRRIETTFNLSGVAVYLLAGDRVYRSRPDSPEVTPEQLREAAFSRDHITQSVRALTLVPILLGNRTLGTLAISGRRISPEVLDAICGLAAVAVERASALETVSRVEASRESERLRNALLDSVTLELKDPLRTIATSIKALRSEPEKDAQVTSRLMQTIDDQSDRLEHLVSQSLQMYELETQEIKLDLGAHSAREVVELALSAENNPVKDHPLEIRLPDELPDATMDIARIAKVLIHLLDNASKYSPAGSPIFVSASATQIELEISVADRGVGIDDTDKSMIFDKFYRGHGPRTKVSGTGMGLAIAQAIVEAHGGLISLTSQPNAGTVFSFTLPLSQR